MDEDPNALIKVAKAVIVDVYEAPGNPLLRVAIDYGAVMVRHDPDGQLVTGGAPLRVASRIEPWVTPSEIGLSDPIKQARPGPSTFLPSVLAARRPRARCPRQQAVVHHHAPRQRRWRLSVTLPRHGQGP